MVIMKEPAKPVLNPFEKGFFNLNLDTAVIPKESNPTNTAI